MSIFRVYIPPKADYGFDEDFRLVRDGKSIFALIAPPIWLIWNKLWLPLLGYLVVATAISLLGVWQPGFSIALLSSLPGLYLFLEGQELIAGKLKAEGWQEISIVEAKNRSDAEIKYIMGAFETGLSKPAVKSNTMRHMPTNHSFAPVVGLFPE